MKMLGCYFQSSEVSDVFELQFFNVDALLFLFTVLSLDSIENAHKEV